MTEHEIAEVVGKRTCGMSEEEMREEIRCLNLSGRDKGMLDKLMEAVEKVGSTVVKVGQWLVEGVIFVANRFPHAVSGLVLGLACGFMVSSIPLVGPVLGLLSALAGLVAGFSIDVINALRPEVESYARKFVFGL